MSAACQYALSYSFVNAKFKHTLSSHAHVRSSFLSLCVEQLYVFVQQTASAAVTTGPSAAELEATRKMQEETVAREKAEQDAALALKKAEIEAAARRQLEEELAALKSMVCMLEIG